MIKNLFLKYCESNKYKLFSSFLLIFIVIFIHLTVFSQSPDSTHHDLNFTSLAKSWDEGIPLGNGMLGVLVWQKGSKLRVSLDRADLWDLRTFREFQGPAFKYKWVLEQYKKGTYDTVQKLFDLPYERDPAPTKIPAGALEFDISKLGDIDHVHLFINKALCEVRWKNGTVLQVFVDANKPMGWYRFINLKSEVPVELIPPAFESSDPLTKKQNNNVVGQGLARLGYKQGMVKKLPESIDYHQEGWGDFSYDINVKWKKSSDTVDGYWCVSSRNSTYSDRNDQDLAKKGFLAGFDKSYAEHQNWWANFWSKSSISIPDSILEKQWYLEMYKFGSASRKGSPPITLQAIWTADNGNLPPWKGDFHNDLNTQLSYWPGYASNHMDEAEVFTDWLTKIKPEARKYTKEYFDTEGINYPGVTTLNGQPMGGWIQYSFSPTIAAWLAHHYYLTWQYSSNKKFLLKEAYPFLSDVAAFINAVSVKDIRGKRKLPISSSPEINDNSINAWFYETTNYDLALIRWLYAKTAELAIEAGKPNEAKQWKTILSEWPELAVNEEKGLLIAPNYLLKESHRHFSHLMAIYPLCLLNLNNAKDSAIISGSLKEIERLGPKYWCGYSYSWYAALLAQARKGDKAAEALRIFSTAFCLPNSFHVNGDQLKKGYSQFTYRPFTLEGNFAFANALQQMLMQSHKGYIEIFPAIPASWKNVSFENLRTYGAFLVSAKKENGKMKKVEILCEKGGKLKIMNPFYDKFVVTGVKMKSYDMLKPALEMDTEPGMKIVFSQIEDKQ